MIKRTVSGRRVAGGEGRSTQLARWQARDEWGQRVVLTGDPDDPDTIDRWFRAPDAGAAAELVALHLLEQGKCEGSTTVDVCLPPDTRRWLRVEVDVELADDVEVTARRVRTIR